MSDASGCPIPSLAQLESRIPAIESAPPEEILNHQLNQIQETLAYTAERSPYYRRLFRSRGIDARAFRGWEDLEALPLTAKDDLQAHNWEFLCVDFSRVVDVVATSGTTGRPIYIALTRADLDRLAENEFKGFLCAGIAPEDTVLLAVTLDNMFVAGLAYGTGLMRLGAAVIRQGPGNALRHLHLMRELGVTGVVAVPSFLLEIARIARREGLRPDTLGLKKAVLVGESIRNPDLSFNALGRQIQEAWGARLFSSYGLTEACTSMCECEAGQGGHLHPDLLLAEIVDDAGKPLGPHRVGELVITTFGVEAMPLVRYRTGDVTFLMEGPCACGRTAPRIGPILGRKSQMIKLKGAQLYPGHIEECLREIPEVVNYQIEVFTGSNHSDRVVVHVGATERSQRVREAVQERIRARARVTPEVSLEAPEVVHGRLFEGGSRKPRRFLDRRTKPA